jgi:hypothetical protein
MAEERDYVPMPTHVVSSVEETWAKDIKDARGKPVFVLSH